jgi:hypothetical protein
LVKGDVDLYVNGIPLVVQVRGPTDVDFKVDGWIGEVEVSENEVRKFQT